MELTTYLHIVPGFRTHRAPYWLCTGSLSPAEVSSYIRLRNAKVKKCVEVLPIYPPTRYDTSGNGQFTFTVNGVSGVTFDGGGRNFGRVQENELRLEP